MTNEPANERQAYHDFVNSSAWTLTHLNGKPLPGCWKQTLPNGITVEIVEEENLYYQVIVEKKGEFRRVFIFNQFESVEKARRSAWAHYRQVLRNMPPQAPPA